jgi:phosphoribosylformylglycinamidine synthase
MKFTAEIDVMPKKELLDPQGKAVMLGLEHLGLNTVQDVRVGKHITLQLEAANEAESYRKLEDACKKLLSNLIMESYRFELHQN